MIGLKKFLKYALLISLVVAGLLHLIDALILKDDDFDF